MKTIRTLVLCAAILACTAPTFAQPFPDGLPPGHKPPHEHATWQKPSPALANSLREFHLSAREWTKTNVFPTLLEWKKQIDAQLEPADLATLNELRAKASDLRRRGRELFDEVREARKSGDKEARKQYKEQVRALHSERRELADAVRPLIKKYKEQLKALREQARPARISWKETRDKQWHDWFTEASKLAQTETDREFMDRLERRHDHKRHDGKDHGHKYHMAVRFLLWDGAVEDFDMPGFGEAAPFGREGTPGEVMNSGLDLGPSFPNPADAHTSLTFTLPEAGTATITLYNSMGTVATTPAKQYYEAGEHTIDIITRELPSGVYRYSIEVNGKQQSGSLQVVH
jgi:hypothetical protein